MGCGARAPARGRRGTGAEGFAGVAEREGDEEEDGLCVARLCDGPAWDCK